ncbi:type III-B CRISPR module RAMP protein Cmr4 [Candidatus Viridilinea mediisalina]|uniref:Type III-B CRISPR module RAMP protein Cmr4 n=1 Tax=Candidatus Viridilinea mediisalina TaxID=2024553 RepID=A0A2A6RP37_9CHLR|nr:type III-B CRISPR module RAMP protein Cmr4 [Candidatus Viridilinea mediisalina]PDW04676.1 type III-B CRISPR module RAMP protein Cmr4 [Candidatus Viridilinea mediisalina]
MSTRLLFVHALSPLHAGTGQGVGVIDLPIAREKATGLPYLPGSSLKGTLRDTSGIADEQRQLMFGLETTGSEDHASSVRFSDQRLLLMPVRSLAGTFAWVTSPYVLRRFARDARDAGVADVPTEAPEPTTQPKSEQAIVCDESSQLVVSGTDLVVLEDLDLAVKPSPEASIWAEWLAPKLFPDTLPDAAYWQGALKARLCIVRDDILDFLLNTATEVVARVRLEDERKTVIKGGLWYEEALPTETILAGLVVAAPVTNKHNQRLTAETISANLERLTQHALQFGGKASVGRGLCRVQLL